MIKIEISGALVKKFLRDGIRGELIVTDDRLPEDAELKSAHVDHQHGHPILNLFFEDGNSEIREFSPTFSAIERT